jgi:NAD(P)-dependent dehydrogenase (short-subunit alcohol dehydrogenase family)
LPDTRGISDYLVPAELVVVTGASSGIGRATAEQLAGAGFQILAGVRNARDAEAVTSNHIEAVQLDITDEQQVAKLARRVESDPQARPLRALVNNAGIAVAAPVEVIPLAAWRRQFETNFFGHVGVIQALLPARACGTAARPCPGPADRITLSARVREPLLVIVHCLDLERCRAYRYETEASGEYEHVHTAGLPRAR